MLASAARQIRPQETTHESLLVKPIRNRIVIAGVEGIDMRCSEVTWNLEGQAQID